MPSWLKKVLIWKGHLILWSTALLALFWLLLVLLLQLLASRPETLATMARWADADLHFAQFESESRPFASSVYFHVQAFDLQWSGGRIQIEDVRGDLNLWNLLWPDLAVGKAIRIVKPELTLFSEDSGIGSNPIASPWLRLWEDTQVIDAKVTWQADYAWTLDQIQVNFKKDHRWAANMQGILHYPNFPAIPVAAQATIDHQFGFHPRIHFSAQATPEALMLLGQDYGFHFDLNGEWNEEALQASLVVDIQDNEQLAKPIVHHVLGRVRSDDLRMWDVTVEQLVIAEQHIDLPVWPRLTIHPQTGALLTLNQVTLTKSGQWLSLMPEDVQVFWQKWQPELWLKQLSLHWGANGQLDDIRGGIDDLSWHPTQGFPGMVLHQLTFQYDPEKGQLQVVPLGNSQLFLHTANGAKLPVVADPLVLRIDPQNPFLHWSLPSWQFYVGKVQASVLANVQPSQPSQFQLGIKTDELASLMPLLPIEQGSSALQKWVKEANISGQALNVQCAFNGALSDLLVGALTEENFKANISAQNVSLKFDRDYPAITHANVQMSWLNNRLKIASNQAQISGAKLQQVVVDVLYLPEERVALRINGLAEGDLNDAQHFLMSSPVAKMLSIDDLLKETKLTGSMLTRLSLWIPLDGFPDKEAVRVRGVVNTQTGRIDYAGQTIDQIATQMTYSDMGLDAPSLTAKWHGEVVNATLTTDRKQRLLLNAQSNTPVKMPHIARGRVQWRADVVIPPDNSIQFAINGDQQAMAIDLPAPFFKASGVARPFQIKGTLAKDALVLSGTDSVWRFSANANQLIGKKWQLTRVALAPQQAKPLALDSGVANITLSRINGDAWASWWRAFSRDATQEDKGMLPETGVIRVDQVDWWGQHTQGLKAQWQLEAQEKGAVQLTSSDVQGKISWATEGISVQLDRLLWKREVESAADRRKRPTLICDKPDKTPWQPIQVDIKKLVLETWRENEITTSQLTDIHGRIVQQGDTRSLKNMSFNSGSVKGKVDWVWDIAGNNSSLFVKARAEKADDLTAIFGVKNAINGGSIDFDSLLSWSGGMDCFDLSTISGNINLRADDGTLTETSPGFSRLLGLLSFDAFTRRLKIGLSDVVNQGLAFDKIEATAQLDQGIANIKSLALQSPSVNISMQGSSDLINETHKLDAKVTPLIGDSLPTVALLSGASPVTAIGYYLLQKVIPPLSGNLLTLHYHISGSWQEPILDELAD